MRVLRNPAVLVGLAMAVLFAVVWLVGYLAGYSGELETFTP
ncbi:MAG: hypothetical protein AB2385_04500 [Symbiobacterium sp.]